MEMTQSHMASAGGPQQLMSDDDDEDDEEDAGVAGLTGEMGSEEEDLSAGSSSDIGTDDSDEYGEQCTAKINWQGVTTAVKQ